MEDLPCSHYVAIIHGFILAVGKDPEELRKNAEERNPDFVSDVQIYPATDEVSEAFSNQGDTFDWDIIEDVVVLA